MPLTPFAENRKEDVNGYNYSWRGSRDNCGAYSKKTGKRQEKRRQLLGLLRLRRPLHELLSKGAIEMKLSVSQLKYMLVLGKFSGDRAIRTAEVAKRLNIQRSSAFNMLNRLSEAGMIVKNEDKTVSLTDKGERTAGGLMSKYNDITSKLEKYFGLSPEDSGDCALMILSCTEDIL